MEVEVESGESPAGLEAGEAEKADASADDTDEPIFIVLYIIQIYYFTKINKIINKIIQDYNIITLGKCQIIID
jgi:hypothetical protein